MKKGVWTGIFILLAAILVFILWPEQDYHFDQQQNREIPYHLDGASIKDLTPKTLQMQIEEKPSTRNLLQNLSPSERRDANQVLAVIERYNRALALTFLTGKYYSISPQLTRSPLLEKELNARSQRLIYEDETLQDEISGYRLKLKILNIKIAQDKAKVLIYRDLTVAEKETQSLTSYGNPEGYTLEKVNQEWKLVNVLSCEGHLSDDCKALDKSKNPEEWVTTFSYENCPSTHDHENQDIIKIPAYQTLA